MPSYCHYVLESKDPLHTAYHDSQYGFPLASDSELFCRLILEINQAGLSWTTILKKQESFRKAYAGFDIRKIARFGEKDLERLMGDAGIIRNGLKVQAAISNARAVLELSKEHGSFDGWLAHHHPLPIEQWTKLFKKTFRFTGGEFRQTFGALFRDTQIFIGKKTILKTSRPKHTLRRRGRE